MSDYISRADAIEAVCGDCSIETKNNCKEEGYCYEVQNLMALPSADVVDVYKAHEEEHLNIINRIKELQYAIAKTQTIVGKMVESADAVHGEWTPCGEKMPKELERVNVTWLNHNPPFYYQHIKDIPQTDTAVYYRGKWYWWDATVIDVLAEYGEDCDAEQIDKDIEVVAWMPLPTPYKGGDTE